MTEEQKQRLEQQLWNIANELRGKMDADEFRDYILGFIFYKYLSEKQHLFANKLLETEDVKDYAQVTDQDDIEAIKEESLVKLGYFLHPEELFTAISDKGNADTKGKSNFILEDLQAILNSIEQSTMGTDSEDDFNKLFEDLDLNSTKLGRSVDARNSLIARVLKHLDKIDFELGKVDADVLGDAYEYLISKFASGAGKKAGEFYTPQQVSKILAKIVTIDKKRIKSAYDPACGSGSLLLRIAKEADVGSFYGQELNRTTYNLARMNMILHDVHFSRFDIKQEDTLEEPQHLDQRFEAVVANPPFSAKWKGSNNPLNETDERFSQYGKLAPSSKADFAFVQHMIYQLADNGTAAVVLPHGVLFRGAAEGTIREYMIKELNYLDAIISLPPNLFYGTSIPACILILKKCRVHDDNILVIDASRDFLKLGNKNALSDTQVEAIVDAYEKRADVEKFAHVTSMSEIEQNDFNLNIPMYVDAFELEPPVDTEAVAQTLQASSTALSNTDAILERMSAELGMPAPSGYNVPALLLYKLACTQKIFSRDVRFLADDGTTFPAWKPTTLGKTVNFSKGKGISKDDAKQSGATPCIRYGEIYTEYSERISSVVSYTDIPSSDLVLSKEGDVIIPASGEEHLEMARACCVEVSGVALGGDINILRGAENGVFLAYYLNNAKKIEIAKRAQGYSVVHLYGKQLKKLEIELPHKDEQFKISEFLSAIDTKISLLSDDIERAQATGSHFLRLVS